MACTTEVNRINSIIIATDVIPSEIDTLPTMSTVMEEETIMRLSVLHQPLHRTEYIVFSRLRKRIWIIVREDDHVVEGKAVEAIHEHGYISGIVDTSPQLYPLADIIDPND